MHNTFAVSLGCGSIAFHSCEYPGCKVVDLEETPIQYYSYESAKEHGWVEIDFQKFICPNCIKKFGLDYKQLKGE
jgi:hypothetical protein